jgi:hypothetical protein
VERQKGCLIFGIYSLLFVEELWLGTKMQKNRFDRKFWLKNRKKGGFLWFCGIWGNGALCTLAFPF